MYVSDAELMNRWRTRRDADAFAEIVSRHADMVFAACHRVLRNAADAEDAAQDCFVTLMNSRPRVQATLGPWLYTVARNRALDRVRSDTRRRARETANAHDTPLAADPSRAELLEWTDEAIEALPEPLREAVVERFLEGKAHGDIAAAMGVSNSTVRYRVNKGVERIRRALRAKGVSVTAVGLTALLGTDFVQAAPVGLKASAGKLAIAGTGATGASALAAAGGMVVMKKAVIGIGLGIAVAALLAWTVLHPSDAPEVAEDVVEAKTAEVPATVEVDESAGDVRVTAVADEKPTGQDEGEPPARVLQHAEIADPVRYATVMGTVRTEGGDPVAGAEVILAAQGYEAEERLPSPYTEQWVDRAMRRNHHFRAASGPDGAYRITGINFRGHAYVYASTRSGRVVNGSISATLSEGESVEGVDIVVRSASAVRGHVVTPSNAPVTDATIRPHNANGGLAHTDADGVFELVCGIPSMERVQVTVFSEAHGTATFNDIAMNTPAPVDLRMPAPAVLRGNVKWREGRPATDLVVSLQGGVVASWQRYDDGSEAPGATGRFLAYMGKVGEDGKYEIAGLDPGQRYYRVAVEDGEGNTYAESSLEFLPAGRVSNWDVVLDGLGEVFGTVVGEVSGKPIQTGRLSVSAVCEGRTVQDGEVGEDGSFRLQLPAKPGPYLIVPTYDLFAPGGSFLPYGREVRIASGSEEELNLKFVEPCALSVRVVDEEGKPIPGAKIIQRDLQMHRHLGATNADGKFTCRSLFSGVGDLAFDSYLIAQHAGYIEASTSIYGGEPGAVYPEETLVLYPSADVTGQVVDGEGQPLDVARVRLESELGGARTHRTEVHTNSRGEFVANAGIPATAAMLRVSVRPADTGEWQEWRFESLAVSPGETADLGPLVYAPIEEEDEEGT